MPNALVTKVWTPLEWIGIKMYKNESGRWYYRKTGKQMRPVKGVR